MGQKLYGWIHSKKTVYKCKVVPEIVPDQNKAQYLGGSDNSVCDPNSGFEGWDNGTTANRESDIRLVDYDQMTGLE